jgi:threonine/homoserine/homoserine lactone efflux protein
MEIVTGIVLGLSTLLFMGPVFFYLIKSTLAYGKRAGFAIALGIIIGDIIYVLLALKGFGFYFSTSEVKNWVAIIGGIILLLMGLKYLLSPKTSSELKIKNISTSFLGFLIKGFSINFLNPFVITVWLLFLSINTSKFSSESQIIVSLIATLGVILLTDCLKVIFAHKIKSYIQKNTLKIAFRITGIIFIGFAIRLFLYGL